MLEMKDTVPLSIRNSKVACSLNNNGKINQHNNILGILMLRQG
jgi:hypothetical protein